MGFFRIGTAEPLKILKVIKGVISPKCKKCNKPSKDLVDGLCPDCRVAEPKK